MELSKQTLDELELFFESEKIGDRMIQVPFSTERVSSKLIIVMREYLLNKMRKESTIEHEVCLKIAKGLLKLGEKS